MTVDIEKDGTIVWKFYRKAYKKARFRRHAQRQIDWLTRDYPGHSILIIAAERTY